jgi:hypothetical protein
MGLRSFVKWLLGYKKNKKNDENEKVCVNDEQVRITNIKIQENGEIDANINIKDAVTEVIEQLKLDGLISCSSIDNDTPTNTPTGCRTNDKIDVTDKVSKMVLRPKKRVKKRSSKII